MSSPKQVEFFFDVGSPASYLAWTQLGAITQGTGATVVYEPMLLGGVFQATGNHSPVTVPAKGKYVFKDFARFAMRYGVPLNSNPHFPINTLTLMRAAVGLQMRDDARFGDYVAAMFKAIWVDAKNMNDPATVGAVLQAAASEASSSAKGRRNRCGRRMVILVAEGWKPSVQRPPWRRKRRPHGAAATIGADP